MLCLSQKPRSKLLTFKRMAQFGAYGPLAKDGRLRSGIRGHHVVTDMELRTMIEEMLREDILQVYVGKTQMSREAQDVIISQADAKVKHVASKTPDEIVDMFSDLDTNEEGKYSFHEMQRIIYEERKNRIKGMTEKKPKRSKRPKNEGAVGAGGKKRSGSRKRAASVMSDSPPRKVDDEEAFLINEALLKQRSFMVSTPLIQSSECRR